MSLYLFRLLIEYSKTQLMFFTNLSNGESQNLMDWQLFSTLIWLGSYRNTVFLDKVGDLYGIRKSTVD